MPIRHSYIKLATIITHELGHFLIHVAEKKYGFAALHRKIEAIVSDNAYNASPYGQESNSEAYAEAFVAHLRGDLTTNYPAGEYRNACNAQVKALWDFLDSILK